MSKKFLTLLALVVGITTTIGVTQAIAYQGNLRTFGHSHTEERETAMETIMADKDYEGWVALMTEDGRNPGVLNKIDTQEEFEKFAQAYVLAHEGNTEEANAIRLELGLGNGQGNRGNGQHRRNRNCNMAE